MKVLLVALGVCLDVTGVEEIRGLDGRKAPVGSSGCESIAGGCLCVSGSGWSAINDGN